MTDPSAAHRPIPNKGDLWGPGPWVDEPDSADWTDPATGLACHAHRNTDWGTWSGYVAVTSSHPLYGATPARDIRTRRLCAHLEITWAALLPDCDDERRWWFGFHCCYLGAGDIAPCDANNRPSLAAGEYRDLAYTKGQCAQLAAQLAEAAATMN